MIQVLLRFTMLSLLACLTFTAVWAEDVRITLPGDKKAAVTTLDMFGKCEFGKRKNDEPLMVVRADGSVQVGSPYDYQSRTKGSISANELNELLAFIIGEQDFFDLKTETIKAELKGRRIFYRCPQPTSTITVHANGKRHTVQCHALQICARTYPDMKSAVRLYAVEQRLRRLMGLAQIGGKTELAGWLAHVNKKLTTDHKELAPLLIESFQRARKNKGGEVKVDFVRTEKDGSKTRAGVLRTTGGKIVAFVEPPLAK